MKFLGKKFLRLIIVILVVTALTFLMVNILPGDVAYEIAGPDAALEDVKEIQEELGLTKNIFLRYAGWLGRAVTGDFGTSFRTHRPVFQEIFSRLPVTIELLILSQILALALAIPSGIISGYKAQTGIDRTLSSAAFAMISIPVFVLALVLIFVFALKLKWLPATGYTPISNGIWLNLRGFLLPASSIALVEWVPLMRVLRSDMIATLKEDYILMARSKGLPVSHVLFRHALRPSSFTLITILGIQIGHLIGGSLIIEIIFALPGIGRLFISSIFARDFYMVQGCVLFIAVAYVVINFVVDVFYSVLDPRIHLGKQNG